MTQRTSSIVSFPGSPLTTRRESSRPSSEATKTGAGRRAQWMHAKAKRFSTLRRRSQLFFVGALLAMLVALGVASTSSTHVLERATQGQQADASLALQESAEPVRVDLAPGQ